jgi:hypothetical protein
VPSGLGARHFGIRVLRLRLVAGQLVGPAFQQHQAGEVGTVLLLFRERVLQQAGPERCPRILVIRVGQVGQAAVVKGHGPFIGLAFEFLGAFGIPQRTRLGGGFGIGEHAFDDIQRQVEVAGRFRHLVFRKRRQAGLQRDQGGIVRLGRLQLAQFRRIVGLRCQRQCQRHCKRSPHQAAQRPLSGR